MPDSLSGLFHAAVKGDAATVKRLVAEDPSLMHANGPHPHWGGRPHALHLAGEWGNVDAVLALLDAGADPNVDSSEYDGWTPLHIAIHADHGGGDHRKVVELLLAAGAVVDIFAAAALGDSRRLREFLVRDPNAVHARGPNNATPLHFVNTIQDAQVLLDHGADPGARDKYDHTPARCLSGYGRRFGAALFLSKVAGEMDLFRACAFGLDKSVVAVLEEDPSLVHIEGVPGGWPGETLLNVACLFGCSSVAHALVQRGADVNRKAPSGLYPLHCAARNGHVQTAAYLLNCSADRNVYDGLHNATPLDWARFQRHAAMVELLASQEEEN